MITRIEIDGFKNLVDFTLDFGPLTCIAGPNSAGKSNIFDAIQFLSFLTDHTLIEAALKIRDADRDTSDVRDLFWTDGEQRRQDFKIAVEMIVNPDTKDDFGRPAIAASTFLRYEITINYESPAFEIGSLGRLVLDEEKLDYIKEKDARDHLHFPHSAQNFREPAIINRRRTNSSFIYVQKSSDGIREIVVSHEAGARGPGQRSPADSAPSTIVGTSNSSATPTILAARREMQSWRLLALEPSVMRKPDRFYENAHVSPQGGHLPSTLRRLANGSKKFGREAEDIYAEITSRLSEFVVVSKVEVISDDVRQLLTLQITELSGVKLPASSLSDGTLRFLALAIIAADPESTGVICMEEPENGIHPAKLNVIVNLLRDIAVDTDEKPGQDNPLRQIIVATHSPYFVQLQNKEDLVFALEASIRGKNNKALKVLRCQPLEGTWRARKSISSVGFATVLAYLTNPPDAQLKLPEVPEVD
jgi:predicted ATPase